MIRGSYPKLVLAFITLVAVCSLHAAAAQASTIQLDMAFSNYEPDDPMYSLDYGTVTLTQGDFNADGYTDVQFIVDVRPEAGGAGGADADLHLFYFNMDPNDAALSISGQDIETISIDFTARNNKHKADGDGYFDVVLDFGTGSDTVIQLTSFIVSLVDTDLLIENFADDTTATQSVGGNKGGFTTAVHIQSTSTDPGSEFVGGNGLEEFEPLNSQIEIVPLPGSLLLLGGGVFGLAGIRRARGRRS